MSFPIKRPIIMLFSQTGSECLGLISYFGQFPDALVVHENFRLNIIPQLTNLSGIKQYKLPNKPTVADYEAIFSRFTNPIITLHGYLRILPKEICEKYSSIINLHPADISKYPELKGLDPIKRVINNSVNYPTIGVTLHRAVSEVDSGRILINKSADNPDKEEEVYKVLKQLAFKSWVELFDNLDQYKL